MRGTAELIITGDELLRGDIVNTNQAFLGDSLLDVGLFATHALSVTDDLDAIAAALQAALIRRPDAVIISGGLGPTEDDLTREAVSSALGRPLEHHDELLVQIQARFGQLGIHMGDSNRKQALIPEGATPIPFSGTAPGFWLITGDTLVAALPGVPRELVTMWTETVGPSPTSRLREARAKDGRPAQGVVVRRLRVYGIGESTLAAELLGEIPWRGHGVDIGTRAALDGLTLTLRAQPTAEAHALLARIEQQVRDLLGTKMYGTGDADLAGVVGGLLRDRGLTVATAESCTGGLVAKRLTDVPGSSDYFLGGVIAYSNPLKTALLGVEPALLEAHGAVSEEVAAAMAVGACERLGTDCAISTTGIAGPGGGTSEKPVGLVYVGTATGDGVVRSFTMFRSRDESRARTAQTALDLLRRRFLDPLER